MSDLRPRRLRRNLGAWKLLSNRHSQYFCSKPVAEATDFLNLKCGFDSRRGQSVRIEIITDAGIAKLRTPTLLNDAHRSARFCPRLSVRTKVMLRGLD